MVRRFFLLLAFALSWVCPISGEANEPAIPKYLYKIVTPEEWQESQLKNHLVKTPIDTDFIHFATEEQILPVVQEFWKNKDLVILKFAPNKFVGRLIYETNPGRDTLYYHLYDGSIPLEAVVDFRIILLNKKCSDTDK